jgi:hypothetical protein
VNKQIAILEDEINKEKKRQKKELQNLQAALDENEKMENLQTNVNSIIVCYFLNEKIINIIHAIISLKIAERSQQFEAKHYVKIIIFFFMRSYASCFLLRYAKSFKANQSGQRIGNFLARVNNI